MAKAADQFRGSDVARWGGIALSCWAMAVLAANVSGLIPQNILAALHSSRVDGGTVNQLRSQVASLQQAAEKMKRDNDQLNQQIALGSDATMQIGKRVGALEVSLPKIVEAQSQLESELRAAQPPDTTVTGGIKQGQVLTFEAEGGTVAVQQRPLMPSDGPGISEDLPMPSPGSAGPAEGVALGFPIDPTEAEPSWLELLANAGTLLDGYGPVLAPVDGDTRKRLVAGPLPDAKSAGDLCRKLDAIAIPCEVAAFIGDPVALSD